MCSYNTLRRKYVKYYKLNIKKKKKYSIQKYKLS